MRKIICLFLILFMICGLTVPLEAAELALPPLNTELLLNGNFSTPPDNTKDWRAFSGEWDDNAYTTYVRDPLNENNTCVKVSDFKGANNKVANPYVKQEVSVVPGAKYVLTAKVYSDKTKADISSENGAALIKLEFFNQNGGESKLGSYQVTDGSWLQISHEIIIPASSAGMRVLLRQQGVGYMYFDDISLKMIEAPTAIHIETDEVFYYSDHSGMGTAVATLNIVAYPELAGKEVDFYLKKNGVEITKTLSVSPVNNEAFFEFDTAFLKDKQTEYIIEAVVHGYTDSRCRNSWRIYRFDRPKALDEKGIYYKMRKNSTNGLLERTDEVIRPVFAYRYRNYQFELGVPNGIIIAQLAMPQNKDGSYYSIDDTVKYLKDALDNAQKAGVMCMIALYRNAKPAGNELNYDVTKRVVQEFCNHEALFAWMVMDETFTHFANPHEDLRKSYILIRENDPNHPVYLCEATSRLEEAGRYTDILCVDPYPASYEDVYDNNPNSPYSAAAVFPSERVAQAVDAVGDNKPVYSLLQAFRWEGSHPDYFPTGDELRNMLYQSIIAGASGVGYFKFDNSDGNLDLNETPLWPYITAFSKNELIDAFDAFVYGKYPIFGDIRNKDYWAVSFRKSNTLHVIVLNRKKTAETISVPLINKEGTKQVCDYTGICMAGSTDEFLSGNSILSASLPAGGAALYKINPEKYREHFFYESFESGIENITSADGYSTGIQYLSEENGNHCLEVISQNTKQNRAVIQTPLLNAGTYRITFKAKPLTEESIPRLDANHVSLDEKLDSGNGSSVSISNLGELNTERWTEYTAFYTISGTTPCYLYLYLGTNSGMKMAYDDIRIDEIEKILLFQNGIETNDFTNGIVSALFSNVFHKNVLFFLATYATDSRNQDEMTHFVSKQVFSDGEIDNELSLQITDDEKKYTIKAFVWDYIHGLSPLK